MLFRNFILLFHVILISAQLLPYFHFITFHWLEFPFYFSIHLISNTCTGTTFRCCYSIILRCLSIFDIQFIFLLRRGLSQHVLYLLISFIDACSISFCLFTVFISLCYVLMTLFVRTSIYVLKILRLREYSLFPGNVFICLIYPSSVFHFITYFFMFSFSFLSFLFFNS